MKKVLSLLVALCAVFCLCFALVACNGGESNASGGSSNKDHEHKYQEKTVRSAGCETEGILVKTCEICQYYEEFSIPAIGHKKVVTNRQEPLCAYDGTEESDCENCGMHFTETLKAPGHDMKYTVTTIPREDLGGYFHYECQRDNCSYYGSRELPTLDSTDYTKTVIDEDTTSYVYNYEGAEIKFTSSAFLMSYVEILGLKVNGIIIDGYTGSKTDLVLPSMFNGCPVIGISSRAFENNTSITSVVIPEPTFTVTSENIDINNLPEGFDISQNVTLGYECIESETFYGCTSLKTVTLPSTLEYIDYGAFSGCQALESINLGGVKYIDDYVFASCEALSSIDLSNALLIGERAFSHCYAITSISTPKVEAIEAGAFRFCRAIESIDLGNALRELGECAFEECQKISTAALPSSLETVYAAPFKGCTGMESITVAGFYYDKFAVLFSGYMNYGYVDNIYAPDIPASLKTVNVVGVSAIPDGAFEECATIEKIVLPENLTSIGSRAFAYCYALDDFYIPESVTSIGKNAFLDVNAFNFNQDFDNKTYYIGSKTNPYFYLLGGDANAVSGENSHVVIQDGCKFVAYGAFTYCSEMTAITIPASVEHLGQISTKSSIVNDQTLDIYYCGTVEEYTELGCICTGWYLKLHVKDGSGFKEVTELVISDKVTEVFSSEYAHYINITSIRIPVTLKKFTGSVFWPSDFEKVYYEGTIADWCEIEFTGESSNPMQPASEFYLQNESGEWDLVTDIVIPEGVTKMPAYTFHGFDGLNTLTIPASMEFLPVNAYKGAQNLSAIYYTGTADEWNEIIYINGSLDSIAKYFYSEQMPSLSDFINGVDATLWHFNEDGEVELWSVARGTSTNNKTYAYTGSEVTVSDDYWAMIVAAKDAGMLEYIFEDTVSLEMAKNSSTKAEYEAALVSYYASWGENLLLCFSDGTLTLSQNTESTTLQYLELDGYIYYVLTRAKGFTVTENGNALVEEITDDYICVTHNYDLVIE